MDIQIDQTLMNSYEKMREYKQANTYPYFPTIDKYHNQNAILNNGSEYLMFGTCDYLGFNNNQLIKNSSMEAIKNFGTNTYGAQISCGYTKYHNQLETKLANLLNKESAILFPSGMSANMALLSTFFSKEDLIINDQFNHASSFLGSKLSFAKVEAFPHGSLNKLEDILKANQNARNKAIVVDGLFSADGDFSDLTSISDLARRYNALFIVDEAHSFGACGPNGCGASEMYGVLKDVDIITGTMSKAIGSVGGYLAGDSRIIEILRHNSSLYTGSRGSPPAVVAASLKGLELLSLDAGIEARRKLWDNVNFLTNLLRVEEIADSNSYIIPVMIGDDEIALRMSNWLHRRGVLVPAMIYPLVPKNRALIRLGVTAWHTKDECVKLASLLCEAKKLFKF
ncbi:MAG: pyridoxal phosphate-dependent aminotransferase family protein [Flavobacteriales bacterium]|nr:pyridoxal phosphate-dependent aminotransferase family protein [Flavobacteriales bacterium]